MPRTSPGPELRRARARRPLAVRQRSEGSSARRSSRSPRRIRAHGGGRPAGLQPDRRRLRLPVLSDPRGAARGHRARAAGGQTNYPPSDGVTALREAVVEHVEREWGARYPVESVLIASGARPILYAAYRCVCNPGDRVVYPVPSWNNNHYCWISGARGVVVVPTRADDGFMPTLEQLAPAPRSRRGCCASTARSTPTGTVIREEQLRRIVDGPGGGERPARPRGPAPPVPAARPGLRLADLRARAARHARGARAGVGSLGDQPGRNLEVAGGHRLFSACARASGVCAATAAPRARTTWSSVFRSCAA